MTKNCRWGRKVNIIPTAVFRLTSGAITKAEPEIISHELPYFIWY
jgi:hypothetical protein